MSFDRFQEISGAGWFESTAVAGAAQQTEKRRQRGLVESNCETNHAEHQAVRIEARFARRNHSSSNWRWVADAVVGLAISTIHVPAATWF